MKLKKYRGQHLLTDRNMLSRIVREAEVKDSDLVVEIGAGTGLLTRLLAESAGRVESFEIERDFEQTLGEIETEYSNLTIHMGDFLKADLSKVFASGDKPWKVVANIPYNITSPIIEKLIEEGRPGISEIYILVQKEVARRIAAKPGGKDYGRLSVYAQFFFHCSILFTVPPEVFTPPPMVESALLKMQLKDGVIPVNPKVFFAVVQAAFAQRRKTLRNAIKNVLPGISAEKTDEILQNSGIDKNRRGETLSLEEFAAISNTMDSVGKSEGISITRVSGGD